MKIQQAISESQKLAEAKKELILERQRKAARRLEEQRAKKAEEEAKRRELFAINSELKKMNAERKKRKDNYVIERTKKALELDDERRVQFVAQKDEFKSLRIKNQSQAQLQRESIQTALRCMAVWNVWDMGVVKKIVAQPSTTHAHTIEDVIRRKAAEVAHGKRGSVMSSQRTTSFFSSRLFKRTARETSV